MNDIDFAETALSRRGSRRESMGIVGNLGSPCSPCRRRQSTGPYNLRQSIDDGDGDGRTEGLSPDVAPRQQQSSGTKFREQQLSGTNFREQQSLETEFQEQQTSGTKFQGQQSSGPMFSEQSSVERGETSGTKFQEQQSPGTKFREQSSVETGETSKEASSSHWTERRSANDFAGESSHAQNEPTLESAGSESSSRRVTEDEEEEREQFDMYS